MPRYSLNTDSSTWSDCDCGDDRNFATNRPFVRKHMPDDMGNTWCALVFLGQEGKPRPLFPLSGAAKEDLDAKLAAKAAAKAVIADRISAREAFEIKRVELKAKVDGGGTLSTDDIRDIITLLIQIPG